MWTLGFRQGWQVEVEATTEEVHRFTRRPSPGRSVHQALSKVVWGRGWRRAEPRTRTCIIGTEVWYLDDEVALRVSGHFGELADQFAELGAAVRIYHPAWRREAGMGPLRAPTITPRTASLREKLMTPPVSAAETYSPGGPSSLGTSVLTWLSQTCVCTASPITHKHESEQRDSSDRPACSSEASTTV